MLRSPFFYIILVLFLFSCKEKTTTTIDTKSIKKEAFNLRNKGIENFDNQKFNSAFYNFNSSKQLYESVKDSTNVTYILIKMAAIQQINGDYYGSKESATEALSYTQNDSPYISTINILLGIADKELYLYNDAIFYYKKAAKTYTTTIEKHAPLNNIAAVYILQKKYDEAIEILEYLLKSLSKKNLKEIAKPSDKSILLDNLGYAYFKKGMHEKAFPLLMEGLQIRIESKDTYGSIESYLHLADYYSKKDLQKSDENALTAYYNATKLNSVNERLEALQILISNDHSQKNKQYAQKFFTINDSINGIRNNFKNKFAKIKYDSKKEKDENQKLRLEKAENLLSLQKAKYLRIVFTIVFVFFVLLIAILIRYYKSKNKAVKFKTSYDTETRIAKKIHDELANDVFNVIAFAESQPLSKEATKENLLQKLDDIYYRVRGISKENNRINTGKNFIESIKEMLSTYNTSERNVMVINLENVEWKTLDDEKKITISRILQELMVNMKKHSQASLVVIKFEIDKKSIKIHYMDNGIGCEKNTIAKNGIHNMESRIQAVKGTIDFETEPDNGFVAKILIPKQAQIKINKLLAKT